MGKNWVHIQDGTGGKEGTPTELVITTNALPNPGDVIAIEGTLYADKDFGAGYKYDVIIENSKVETLTSKKEKN
ncbi:NrfJ [Dissulfuribacter thermophilus]|uniref:NrfJ n=1 Tax=Dissulfuribacter thermophilus TaxID=1156395 RepID=A0A1B9F3D9_9BACT|nr:NrfJ [Dissulfuribacter thermophilus]